VATPHLFYMNRNLLPFCSLMVLLTGACQGDALRGPAPVVAAQTSDNGPAIAAFRSFRNAVYAHDAKAVKAFVDFPIRNEANEIWLLADTNSAAALPDSLLPFQAPDFDRYFDRIFPDAFIATLLKVKAAELFRNGHYETPPVDQDGQRCTMTAQWDRGGRRLTLTLLMTGLPPLEDAESFPESSITYEFDLSAPDRLRFRQVRIAG